AAKRAIPAENVARVVEKALTTARPKTRYLVGTDAKLRALMVKLLPDRLSDKVLTWVLGLPR
ncbi:MAG: short-chain dehydrogenase/reductase, partial [Nitrospira sp.]|nr:short-chain dehydrogenase/reductase [Nitrospira sp.]